MGEKKELTVKIVGIHPNGDGWVDQVKVAVVDALNFSKGSKLPVGKMSTLRNVHQEILRVTVEVSALDALLFGEEFFKLVKYCYSEQIRMEILGEENLVEGVKSHLSELFSHFDHMSPDVAYKVVRALFEAHGNSSNFGW